MDPDSFVSGECVLFNPGIDTIPMQFEVFQLSWCSWENMQLYNRISGSFELSKKTVGCFLYLCLFEMFLY